MLLLIFFPQLWQKSVSQSKISPQEQIIFVLIIFLKTIDKIENKPYINITTFPDCVMVALQILVLIVGVRILLGEYGLFNLNSLFFYPRFFRLSARTWPSQG